jgi:CxxC-x17-CxxC domain-containing protein
MNDFKRNDRFGGKMTGGRPGHQRSGGGFGRPRGQMFPATCAKCGKPCEVPFKPDGNRPIYCSEHFGGKEGAPSRDFQPARPYGQGPARPAFRAPAQAPAQAPDSRIDEIQKQIAKMQLKLDQILLSMAVTKAMAPAPATPAAAAKKKPAKKK